MYIDLALSIFGKFFVVPFDTDYILRSALTFGVGDQFMLYAISLIASVLGSFLSFYIGNQIYVLRQKLRPDLPDYTAEYRDQFAKFGFIPLMLCWFPFGGVIALFCGVMYSNKYLAFLFIFLGNMFYFLMFFMQKL